VDKPPNVTVLQTKNLANIMLGAIPEDLPEGVAARWLRNKGVLQRAIADLLKDNHPKGIDDQIKDWTRFYADVFGRKIDTTGLIIPNETTELNGLVIIPKDMSIQEAWNAYEKEGILTRYDNQGEFGLDNLDEITQGHNDREPTESYALRIADAAESDKKPEDSDNGHNVTTTEPRMTLLERLLFGLKYYRNTGEHLDTETVTCCFGTTNLQGQRPVVAYRNGRVHLLWDHMKANLITEPYWSRTMKV
jgi:hypothetical protein